MTTLKITVHKHAVGMSVCVVQLDLLKDAREALQKVLKLDKTNATALFRMGKVLALCAHTSRHTQPASTHTIQ